MSSNDIHNIFAGQKNPKPITQYMLSRGVVDYSNLNQFDNFETGYAFLILLKIPKFLDMLASVNDTYRNLIDNYKHIIEYDFKSIDGLEDITIDTNELNDGINNLNVITKVNEQSASQFSMRYYERSGSVITKVNELYLRGIKDPRTQVKRYNGLIRPGATDVIEATYANEVFEYLYFVTDNTCCNIEKAYLLVACQPTSAETSMYTYTKGDINWHELNYSFNGYPITGPAVTAKAQDFLDWINDRTVFEESRFGYQALLDASVSSVTDDNRNDQPKSELAPGYSTRN